MRRAANLNSEHDGSVTTKIPCSGCKTECASETVGTFLLVFMGASSVVLASAAFSPVEALTLVALAFGGTVTTVILLLGRISGAHINPAVTFAHGLSGLLDRELLAPYLFFQVSGGLLAGLCLKVAFGSLTLAHLGSTVLAAGVSPVEAIGLEALGTFILALSALSASSLFLSPVRQAVFVGATLSVLILLVGPLTGASFNPARSLGPAVFSGFYQNQLVYWIGPLLGGSLAGLLFGAVKRTRGRARTLPAVCVC